MDDDLFPDRSTEPVCEIVDFIEDDIAERVKRSGMLVEHVTQDFGGHHHDVRLGIDGGVAGEQPDPVGAIDIDQIMVFLVAQRFDRRGVERFDVVFLREEHGEVRDNGLAGTGGCGHEHIAVGFEGFVRLCLEIIQFERQRAGEARGDARPSLLPFTEGCVSGGW